jgi:hypothetical protein
MKFFFLFASLVLVTTTKENCKTKKGNTKVATPGCYKGKLEVKGGCMNYTISITSPNFDTSLVMASWTDENTGKAYQNVFALNSRCTFPGNINEGDEFYFMMDSTTVQNCAVCLMYYPVPPKKLSIKIIPGPCQP